MDVIDQKRVNWVNNVQRDSHLNVGRVKVTFEVCVWNFSCAFQNIG